MTDNVIIPVGTDTPIATDEIGGVHHQLVKVEFGDANSATQVSSSNPLPVTLSAAPLPSDAATETTLAAMSAKLPAALAGSGGLKVDLSGTAANSTAIKTDGSAVTQPVSAASLPLPAGAATETTLGTLLTQSDFDTKVGSLTETAPASDTASSGLNGRLQRIAQRITTLIGSTLAVSGTVTANAGTNLNTSTLAVESGGNLATIAGAVSSSKMAVKAASGDFADGAHATFGAKADAKSTATDTTAISAMSVWKQISASIQAAAASLAGTLATSATQSGTWNITNVSGTVSLPTGASTAANQTAVQGTTGSAVPSKGNLVQGSDGTNARNLLTTTGGVLKVDLSATVANSTAVKVDNSAVTQPVSNGLLTDLGAAEYETVAASQTDQAMGATGGTGDYLAGVLIVPATTSPGAVSIKDGSGSSITIFTGGASSVSNLVPFMVALGIKSTGGAWKVTTGSNVSAIGVGNFT